MRKNSILTKPYVLYVIALFAFINILGYMNMNRYDCLATFVVVGLLTKYFSKNMSVILLTSMIITSIVCFMDNLENMDNLNIKKCNKCKDKKCKKKCKESKSNKLLEKLKKFVGIKEGMKNKDKKKENPLDDLLKEKKDKKDDNESFCWLDGKLNSKAKDKDACDKIQGCWGAQTTCTKGSKKQDGGVKTAKKVNKEGMDDDGMGDRIDYQSTLEESYNNLEKFLGPNGIKGLSQDTKNLVNQQKVLMESLTSMAPAMKEAQNTLQNLDISKLTSLAKTISSSSKK